MTIEEKIIYALTQIAKERAELDIRERGLVKAGRHYGITWTAMSRALGHYKGTLSKRYRSMK